MYICKKKSLLYPAGQRLNSCAHIDTRTCFQKYSPHTCTYTPDSCLRPVSFTKRSVVREAGLMLSEICMNPWESTPGICAALKVTYQPNWYCYCEKDPLVATSKQYLYHKDAYQCGSVSSIFTPCHFDFTVWFVCLANELEPELWGGSFTSRFFSSSRFTVKSPKVKNTKTPQRWPAHPADGRRIRGCQHA